MRCNSVFTQPEWNSQQKHPLHAARKSLPAQSHPASVARESHPTNDGVRAYGRQVTLTLQAPSGGGAREVKLTRQPITFNSVTSDLCGAPPEGGAKTGYIRIATFSKQTPDGVRAAMKSLRVRPPPVPPLPSLASLWGLHILSTYTATAGLIHSACAEPEHGKSAGSFVMKYKNTNCTSIS